MPAQMGQFCAADVRALQWPMPRLAEDQSVSSWLGGPCNCWVIAGIGLVGAWIRAFYEALQQRMTIMGVRSVSFFFTAGT